MKYIIFVLLLIVSIALFNQTIVKADELSFIEDLGKKNIATENDALILYKLIVENSSFSVISNTENNIPLKKGFIAYMVADNLKLTDSLFFMMFKSRRYAFRVCVAHNLLNADGSENDLMSGEDLIEFLTLASEYKDKGAAK
jgi:hypothetical protein